MGTGDSCVVVATHLDAFSYLTPHRPADGSSGPSWPSIAGHLSGVGYTCAMQSGPSRPTPTPPDAIGEPLGPAIQSALDGLLAALVLDPIGNDRFRVVSEPGRFDRVFGGQFVAQALLAACATVEDKPPHSLHAYFVEASAPEQPLDLAVERIRDGRSVSTRRVTVTQEGRTLLAVLASFHSGPDEPEVADPPPTVPAPHLVPLLQDWARQMPADRAAHGQSWVETPPPLELRIPEAPNFLDGPTGRSGRSLWMRLPRQVGADPVLHTALLAYASDYLLLDMVPHPSRSVAGRRVHGIQPRPRHLVPSTGAVRPVASPHHACPGHRRSSGPCARHDPR